MKKGDRYNDFLIKDIFEIEEIHITLIHAIHEENGANVFHIKSDDKENLFGLCFKTYPTNDGGVPHILEHTVLCGSKKFPIHDPFFSMLRRSCNTFMNAFTSKLWTGYVASSQIEKDFYNIFSVYLDAALNPLLTKNSFMQEGHRLEFVDPNDTSSDLQIKGIVFNEMKGVFSNPSSIVWRQLVKHLFPNTTYGCDSGGIPKDIVNLTHQELQEFHKKYYDKRLCNYFFYGDIPLEKHLDFLSKNVFTEKLGKINTLPPIDKIKRFEKPKSIEEKYHSTNCDKDPTYFSLGFTTCGIEDQDDVLTLTLLDIILMDTDASILKKRILQSKLCLDAYGFYDSDAREIPYVFYCIGLQSKPEELEKVILDNLKQIANEGFCVEWIEGALHQLEFSKLEISGSSGPYGLDLMSHSVMPYQQGGSLIDGLRIHSLLNSLREKLKDKNYLSNFIKKHFIENNHRVSFTLYPDQKVRQQEEKQEKDFLANLKNSFSNEQKENIQKDFSEFTKYQKEAENENIECLPCLSLNDIPKNAPYYPVNRCMFQDSTVYHHEVFTNAICYFDLIFDIPQIPENDLPYLKLFSTIIPEIGTKEFSWEKNMRRVQQNFGSLSSSLALNVQKDNINTCYPTLSINSRFLNRKTENCLKVLKDLILNIDLDDKQRIKNLILQIASALESDINKKALSYALKESSSHISPWTHLSNIWYGSPYYGFIKNISKNLDTELDIIIEKFHTFKKTLFHLNNAHIVISSDKEQFEDLKNNQFYDLLNISNCSSGFHPWIELPTPKKAENKGVIISSSIAHNALALPTVTLTSELAPAIKIATYLLENIYIHKMIREKGGAYGSGVKYNILTGVLNFYSYRDPHIETTIEAFHQACTELLENEISEKALLEAILSYIQDVDSPVPVSCRASVTYFQEKVGLLKEVRQQFREAILSLKKEDIQRALRDAIIPGLENAIQVSYSDIQKLENANAKLKRSLKLETI
ncbi:MAG: hypothetical protein S4CHLAM20_02290 [Chlamydiia bacterium]|nr:hypothetical protein [Chlamydiia bacterium]